MKKKQIPQGNAKTKSARSYKTLGTTVKERKEVLEFMASRELGRGDLF